MSVADRAQRRRERWLGLSIALVAFAAVLGLLWIASAAADGGSAVGHYDKPYTWSTGSSLYLVNGEDDPQDCLVQQAPRPQRTVTLPGTGGGQLLQVTGVKLGRDPARGPVTIACPRDAQALSGPILTVLPLVYTSYPFYLLAAALVAGLVRARVVPLYWAERYSRRA